MVQFVGPVCSEVNMVSVTECLALMQMRFSESDIMNVNCGMVVGETDVNQFMNDCVYATVLIT